MLPEWIREVAKKVEPVGSRVVCNPAPTDTDEDWLVLVALSKLGAVKKRLGDTDFELGGSDVPESTFNSYKCGEVNVILTSNQYFFDKFMLATKVCKELNLLEKSHRVAVHSAIIEGLAPGEEREVTKASTVGSYEVVCDACL